MKCFGLSAFLTIYRSIDCGSCISIGGTTGAICHSARGISGTRTNCNLASTSGTTAAVPADLGRLSAGEICARRRKDRHWTGGRLRPSYRGRNCTAAQSLQGLAAG
jgi:hypothetical protein